MVPRWWTRLQAQVQAPEARRVAVRDAPQLLVQQRLPRRRGLPGGTPNIAQLAPASVPPSDRKHATRMLWGVLQVGFTSHAMQLVNFYRRQRVS